MPDEQHSHPFEERLATALRSAGDSFETDRAALAAAGRARGRRALLRRAAVAGGAAGVALAGVGGALVLPGSEASGPQRPSAAAAPTAAPAPAEFSGADLVRTLKGLLPKGGFGEESARGSGAQPGPSVRLVYDDGKGAAAISVSLDRIEPGSERARETTRCPDRALVPHDSCTTSRLPDGSVLMLFQGYEYPDRRVDTKWWNAELVTPEGQHVSVSEWNAPAQKDAATTREEPPLSPARLKRVATAKVWREVVDSIPKRPRPTATPGTPQQVPGRAVGETLAGLLPEDVEVVARGGQDGGYAYAVVDDGRGESFVQINVQPGMSDAAGDLYGSAETLPDGTLVATRQGPGDRADLVMWTVDTLRTDARHNGLRVVVSAFNAGSQQADATRDTPALTMAELRRIALSPKWLEVA
ncbi:hypothetical protein ACIBAI_05480 [Streptomyces sp. NPDC051041]|uniref:hypothetical protein n=1 Tax=Streptomyces sp. NPDC051041 TaxID=3365640 RepID=UPI0037926D75